jgi:tRNA threonylcarbamoyladenosine biosynthesis protein TsaB
MGRAGGVGQRSPSRAPCDTGALVLVLALETSSAVTSVAVVRAVDDAWSAEVLAESAVRLGAAAGEGVVEVIDRVLRAASVAFADVELLAVGVGPGSFTGTRVGVATAKGLAIATGKPLRGVSAFEALAADAGARVGERVLVAIDARKSEIYAAVVTCGADDVAATSEPRHLAPARISEAFSIDDVARAVGDGVALAPALASLRASRVGPLVPRAAAIAAIAGARQRRAPLDEVDVLEPLYVRPPDITMPKTPPGMPGRRT